MPSGRPKSEVDTEILSDLLADGVNRTDIARELGVTPPTLSKRITELKQKEGEILQYRALQTLELTELEAQILDAVTPDKIAQASLRELAAAFKIFKDKELVADGKPSEIKGLVGYLMHLEKEEARESNTGTTTGEVIEAELTERGVSQEEFNKFYSENEEDTDEDDFEELGSLMEDLKEKPASVPAPRPGNAGENTNDGLASTGSKRTPLRRPFPLDELPEL
jgi:DNA-binding Lrp family transcriptional regulator